MQQTRESNIFFESFSLSFFLSFFLSSLTHTHTPVLVCCKGSQESLVPAVLTGHTFTGELLSALRLLLSYSTLTTIHSLCLL